jgi:hypothetical protein
MMLITHTLKLKKACIIIKKKLKMEKQELRLINNNNNNNNEINLLHTNSFFIHFL